MLTKHIYYGLILLFILFGCNETIPKSSQDEMVSAFNLPVHFTDKQGTFLSDTVLKLSVTDDEYKNIHTTSKEFKVWHELNEKILIQSGSFTLNGKDKIKATYSVGNSLNEHIRVLVYIHTENNLYLIWADGLM